ncbi:unnamed protein product, partial [Prorocentrum cordatum]
TERTTRSAGRLRPHGARGRQLPAAARPALGPAAGCWLLAGVASNGSRAAHARARRDDRPRRRRRGLPTAARGQLHPEPHRAERPGERHRRAVHLPGGRGPAAGRRP